MLLRLLPGMMVVLLWADCCRAEDLSERVLFSGMRSGQEALKREDLLPDISELGFDEEDLCLESDCPLETGTVAEAADRQEGRRIGGSEIAHASMTPQGRGPDFDAVPSGDLPPLLLEDAVSGGGPASYPYPAKRGLCVRAGGEMLRGRQELSSLDSSAYSLTGMKYSVGLDCDWSVDTTFGLSLDMLDATVKSALPFDSRQADVNGVFAGVSADSVLFDSYLVGIKGFYGRIDSAGDGSIGSLADGGATVSRWREPGHASGMYGASASVRVPVLFGGYRAVFDAGVDYKRIDTAPYLYRVDASGPRDSSGKGFSSTSIAVPAGVSVEKDFVARRAFFTARMGAGYRYEFSDSANGVRALNALSAVPVQLDADGFHRVSPGFSSEVKGMYRFNLGLDVATAGGWNMALAYSRDFAGGYSSDAFSVELGRSF